MKKIAALLTSVLLISVFCTNALAANNAFVKSPSLNDQIEVVTDDGFEAIEVTMFKDRKALNPTQKEQIEKAYDQVSKTTDLTKLGSDVTEVLNINKIPQDEAAISDLFVINYVEGSTPDGTKRYSIKLKSETFDNFISLLYFDGEEWKDIKNVTFDRMNSSISFDLEEIGVYSIMVKVAKRSPDTGDKFTWTYIIIALVLCAALSVVLVKTRKRR